MHMYVYMYICIYMYALIYYIILYTYDIMYIITEAVASMRAATCATGWAFPTV